MERSRSKRNYSYDQENDTETVGRTRPRYNHHYASNSHRHRDRSGSTARPSKPPDSPATTVTTSYRILCRDVKVGGVVGKSGSIIKSIRQHTGACVNVHELIPGDEERIIEISDTRRRDPDGRMPSFSPAQEALFLIHERILESDGGGGFGMGYHGGEEDEYRGMGGNNMVTRLVVLRMHVGCLMGKRGKIIEQMRIETKTHIRILPRDHTLPRCVSTSEEIVQVVGDVNAVKNAIAIISSRLRESQHRDRSHLHGRSHSPDPFFPPDDDYVPHMNNAARRSSMDGASNGSQSAFSNIRSNNYASRPSAFTIEPGAGPIADNMEPFYGEDLVFRILCPINKINSVVGESDGIVELLQNEIGVDVKVADPVAGSDEQIITISSEEGPDDELFPAQEALLHIQTRIVDLVPDKDNIVTTRLLIPASDIVCLEGISLSEMRKLTGANIQLLPREGLPACVPRSDELLQDRVWDVETEQSKATSSVMVVDIVGEIKAARGAIVEVTSRLRSYLYREFFQMEAASPNNIVPGLERHTGSDPPSTSQNVRTVARQPSKEAGGSGSETAKHNQCDHREDVPVNLNRTPVPLVTRSTLEVVIPEYAVPKLITKSRNKLAQISELSGANMTLVDDRRKVAQNIIQISGTPDQAERAQSLLQGFILSMQEDGS